MRGLGGGNSATKSQGTKSQGTKKKFNKKATKELIDTLEHASLYGNYSNNSQVEKLIKEGADVNALNGNGVTLLDMALKVDFKENVDSLLKAGADLRLCKIAQLVTLMLSMRAEPRPDMANLKMLKNLYDHKADIYWTNPVGENIGHNLADYAINLNLPEVFTWLLSLGIKPTDLSLLEKDESKLPKHYANVSQLNFMKDIWRKHKIENDGDVNQKFQYALEKGQYDQLEVLLEKSEVDIDVLNKVLALTKRKCPIETALQIAKKIVARVDINAISENKTALDRALELRLETSIIHFLLENRVCPNTTNFLSTFLIYEGKNAEEIGTAMLRAGIDVNQKDGDRSILEYAISSNNNGATIFLLKNDAVPNVDDFCHVASRDGDPSVNQDIAVAMIRAGINVNSKEIVQYAAKARFWNSLDLLLAAGADCRAIPSSDYENIPLEMQIRLLSLLANDEKFLAHLDALINRILRKVSNDLINSIMEVDKMGELKEAISHVLKGSYWTLRFFHVDRSLVIPCEEFIVHLSNPLNDVLGKKIFFDKERKILDVGTIHLELEGAIGLFNAKREE